VKQESREAYDAALERLKETRGFVFDLDGTLVLGDKRNQGINTVPGAVELLRLLKGRGVPYLAFTNGTVRTVTQFLPILADIGIVLGEDQLMTPTTVAADYFCTRRYRRIMTMGGEGVWRPLADAGLEIVHSSDDDPGEVDAVYIGWYREFGLKDIEAAWIAIENGAALYSASGTPFFSTADGKGLGTSVVLSAPLEAITGRKARVLGKPSLEGLELAGRRLGVDLPDIAVVGDDPDIEVAMAHRGGSMAIYVHSGAHGVEGLDGLAGPERPHLDLACVGDLLELYRRVTG